MLDICAMGIGFEQNLLLSIVQIKRSRVEGKVLVLGPICPETFHRCGLAMSWSVGSIASICNMQFDLTQGRHKRVVRVTAYSPIMHQMERHRVITLGTDLIMGNFSSSRLCVAPSPILGIALQYGVRLTHDVQPQVFVFCFLSYMQGVQFE